MAKREKACPKCTQIAYSIAANETDGKGIKEFISDSFVVTTSTTLKTLDPLNLASYDQESIREVGDQFANSTYELCIDINCTTRASGAIQVLGGGLELAGARQVWTGETTDTLLVESLVKTGMDRNVARKTELVLSVAEIGEGGYNAIKNSDAIIQLFSKNSDEAASLISKTDDIPIDIFNKPKDTVTVYRVDDNNFAPHISSDGSIPVVSTKKGGERTLFINLGQLERAIEFVKNSKGGSAVITSVEADSALLEKLRKTAIYDKSEAAKLNQNAPLKVDIK